MKTTPTSPDAARSPYAAPAVATPPAEAPRPALTLTRAERVPRTVRRALQTVVQAAEAAGPFTTLVRAVRAAGLAKLLDGRDTFTLFAPTDRAFAKLPPGELTALLEDKARLRRVLMRHVVAGKVKAPNEDAPTTWTRATDGTEIEVTVHGGAFRVNEARLVKPHIRASNGMIRGIDTLLTTS